MAIDVLAKDDQWEIEATSTPEGDPVFYYVVPHNDKRFVAASLPDFAIIWSDSETDEQRIGISDAVPEIYEGFMLRMKHYVVRAAEMRRVSCLIT